MPYKSDGSMDSLSNLPADVQKAIDDGHLVQAIKQLSQHHSLSLWEAKKIIDEHAKKKPLPKYHYDVNADPEAAFEEPFYTRLDLIFKFRAWVLKSCYKTCLRKVGLASIFKEDRIKFIAKTGRLNLRQIGAPTVIKRKTGILYVVFVDGTVSYFSVKQYIDTTEFIKQVMSKHIDHAFNVYSMAWLANKKTTIPALLAQGRVDEFFDERKRFFAIFEHRINQYLESFFYRILTKIID